MAADEQAPEEPGVVETADGVEHVGVVPASAELSVEQRRAARQGWYRSPAGNIAHADGPDQKRAFADRGWDEITEDQAKQAVAERATLEVDRSDTKGTFDDDAVKAAVKNESTTRPRRRRTAG